MIIWHQDNNKFSKAIVSDPIRLVKDGKIIDESMKKAKISKKELESYRRLSGTDDISDIDHLIWKLTVKWVLLKNKN